MSTSDDDAIVLNYKGKTTFDSASYYCPYIPLTVESNTMTLNLKFKDLGEKRWVCYVNITNRALYAEMKKWLQENLQDRYMINEEEIIRDGHWFFQATVRGGDVKDRMLFALRWSNANA